MNVEIKHKERAKIYDAECVASYILISLGYTNVILNVKMKKIVQNKHKIVFVKREISIICITNLLTVCKKNKQEPA